MQSKYDDHLVLPEMNTSSITQYAIVFDDCKNLKGSREFYNVPLNRGPPDIPLLVNESKKLPNTYRLKQQTSACLQCLYHLNGTSYIFW